MARAKEIAAGIAFTALMVLGLGLAGNLDVEQAAGVEQWHQTTGQR